MSTAKLNVWVTRVGDSCHIDNEHQWYVHILHCDGELLRWCDRVYTNLPTKCAHLEVEIPPGCYMVCATWSPAPAGTVTPTTLGNHITHLVVIRADCGDDVCITLFPPTFHWCGTWWLVALREQIALQRFPEQAIRAADAAANAVDELLKQLPMDPLTEGMMRIAENRPRRKGTRPKKGQSEAAESEAEE